MVYAVVFAQGGQPPLCTWGGWSVIRFVPAPTPHPQPGLPREVPTEVRDIRRGTRRQCFLDCLGALRVAMGSDPGNPEWFPRWDL